MKKEFSLEITSNDNYKLELPTSYKLYKTEVKKENELVSMFKDSILGCDIGINSKGFSYIAILATLLAIGSLLIMYILFRVQ